MMENMLKQFTEVYPGSSSPLIVRSPGRLNIIGEHTDYNEGFVLPAAINKYAYVAVNKRDDEEIHLYAKVYHQHHIVTTATVNRSDKHWPNYILGIVDQMQKRGYAIGGFNLLIDGDVPPGAGLSSSAAVECSVAFSLNELFNLQLSKLELVRIAQKAEHSFAGVMCGIMDQFTSVFAKRNHVIKLDCRSLEYEYVPLDLKEYKILLLNTNVNHSLASTEYNTRRQQCEQAVAWIKKYEPEVNSLRDATLDKLNKYVLPEDELTYTRCKYVIEENQRLLEGCNDLMKGDLKALGQKMFRTHKGLSEEYNVSCKELDFLVNAVKDNPDALGARLIGGGFGGCTINIIKEASIAPLVEKLSKDYREKMGLDLAAYVVQLGGGSEVLVEKKNYQG